MVALDRIALEALDRRLGKQLVDVVDPGGCRQRRRAIPRPGSALGAVILPAVEPLEGGVPGEGLGIEVGIEGLVAGLVEDQAPALDGPGSGHGTSTRA